jgi:secreted trypsin-like serine protease
MGGRLAFCTFLILMAFLFSPVQVAHAQDEVGGASPDIVGGEEATPGEFPWQAFLRIGSYICGGSLIAPQWVLTAAHCVERDDAPGQPVPPSTVTVHLGKHNIRQIEASQQTKSVAQVIIHPSYNPNSGDSDIALLRLTSAATLNSRVATIPLLVSPGDDPLTAPGVLATVTGWGTTSEDGVASNTLQKVSIPIVSNATCNQALPWTITQNMICAGYAAGGKDSCQGDSGGPLIVPDGAGSWKQTGVVSFGLGCARPGLYGVYTRISRYIAWIGQYVDLSVLAVNSFSPTSGRPGAQVTLTGGGFSSVTAVEFAGAPAVFSISSDAQIVAVVPQGAVSGPITIRSPYGTAQTTSNFQPFYQLNVQATNNGFVDISPGAARCTSASPCVQQLTGGATATLNPTAATDFVFAGWRGACPPLNSSCSLYMNADYATVAVFAPPISTLSVEVFGNGDGVVTGGGVIDCGEFCTAELQTRTSLVLTAHPGPGMIFTGWQGDCTGLTLTCTVNMVGDQQVAAGFAVAQYIYLPTIRR